MISKDSAFKVPVSSRCQFQSEVYLLNDSAQQFQFLCFSDHLRVFQQRPEALHTATKKKIQCYCGNTTSKTYRKIDEGQFQEQDGYSSSS